jgi:hypothetical protein
MSSPVTFTTSGTVQAQDGTYLTRAADAELFQLCRQGDYAYILTSRQMGKSSLMVATAERLQGSRFKRRSWICSGWEPKPPTPTVGTWGC